MKIILNQLFEHQKKLDETIHKLHSQNYKIAANKLTLALAVELGELANEVRCFKFWSLKIPSATHIILDEYADGLHFITSKAIYYKVNPIITFKKIKPITDKEKLTIKFNELFFLLTNLNSKVGIENWYKKYLELGFALGFNEKQILSAYNNKNTINFQRQATNY